MSEDGQCFIECSSLPKDQTFSYCRELIGLTVETVCLLCVTLTQTMSSQNRPPLLCCFSPTMPHGSCAILDYMRKGNFLVLDLRGLGSDVCESRSRDVKGLQESARPF